MRVKKKGSTGSATNYISRTKALKKLQLSLKDFRRLCILKGIHPHEPLHKKKVNKGSHENKVWYYIKDIHFLTQEPIINKLREYKIFLRKLNHFKAKQEDDKVKKLYENQQEISLDRIVKERYPTFGSALRDLDDALCMAFLFATFPRTKYLRSNVITECKRLSTEFLHYVIESHSLTNVFVSIKGIYYQAMVGGEKVTWIVPHERGLGHITDVDFSVMATFAEFYVSMLGFVNYKLYQTLGLYYPPRIETGTVQEEQQQQQSDEEKEKVYSLCRPIARSRQQEQDEEMEMFEDGDNELAEKLKEAKKLKTLFQGCNFFVNRECPKEALALIVRNCGGKVTWEGAPFELPASSITHHIIDRPVANFDLNRVYIQPQWVFDCLNARRKLPTQQYLPGQELPPHFSPFIKEKPGDYVPIERIEELRSLGKDTAAIEPERAPTTSATKKPKMAQEEKKGMSVETGKMHKKNAQKEINKKGEERKIRELMIKKKHKRVYDKLTKGIKRHRGEAKKLAEKRQKLDKQKA
ncbi:unnamed protein product, partial [Mesorhabditis belari]|uniref:Pescadillo homolog n=1 Tax=Mesorhabditis belari TaxID=2138241 RepID=A0AAF3EM69_9BILA